jgi:predicted phosphodiesterase
MKSELFKPLWTIAALTILATLASTNTSSAEADNTPEKIVILGDRTGGHRPGVFEQAIELANQQNHDLVLSVGDLIEGYSQDTEQIETEWTEVQAMLAKLRAPFFATPGNHDISNAAMKTAWLKRYAKTYRSERIGELHLLILDTEDPPFTLPTDIEQRHHRLAQAMQRSPLETQKRVLEASRLRDKVEKPGVASLSETQVEFIENALIKNQEAALTIVLMHKPLWDYNKDLWTRLTQNMPSKTLAVAGHEHYITTELNETPPRITMGTSGGVWLKDGEGRKDHILVIDTESGDVESIELSTIYNEL